MLSRRQEADYRPDDLLPDQTTASESHATKHKHQIAASHAGPSL
jgi:hypothetical protein